MKSALLAAAACGLIVDNFAGGGGASTGIEQALGRAVDIAINHDEEALRMHEANHPDTLHIRNNIWKIDPIDATGGKPVGLAWFSPDCKHFSKAKGGKPRDKSIRDLAWVVVLWAKRVKPNVIFLENVEEFRSWGPLCENGFPIKERAGETFAQWCNELRRHGYKVQFRELRACDYGAPTIRKRLFMIARRDGEPIVWPSPTHGKPDSPDVLSGKLKPWRTAAEIIDWSLPCPSIFERKKALADKTLRRIAHGIVKFVLNNPKPFVLPVTHHGGPARVYDVEQPLHTVTGANRGEIALATPYFARTAHGDVDSKGKRRGQPCHGAEEPFPTVLQTRDSALVVPHITKFREGSIGSGADEPIHTITANSYVKRPGVAAPFGVVSAFLAQFSETREGRKLNTGHSMEKPVSTIVQRGPLQALVTSNLVKLRGTCRHGQSVEEPLHTVTSGGTHIAEVRALLLKYCDDANIPASIDKDGAVLVEIAGETYVIVDIGMRMLSPRELFNAQGFPPDYIIDRDHEGRPITKTAQVAKCGNSVPPPVARALVAANVSSADAVEESVAA